MSLLTQSQIDLFSGKFGEHFSSFSRPFTIFKEPKKVITNVTSKDFIPGYGIPSAQSQVTYIPISGIYSGIISYNRDQKIDELFESNKGLSKGQVRLKVQEDAKNFIENGKNENFIVDGLTYNVVSDFAVQNYLGLTYFYYTLEQTK